MDDLLREIVRNTQRQVYTEIKILRKERMAGRTAYKQVDRPKEL